MFRGQRISRLDCAQNILDTLCGALVAGERVLDDLFGPLPSLLFDLLLISDGELRSLFGTELLIAQRLELIAEAADAGTDGIEVNVGARDDVADLAEPPLNDGH